MKIIADENIIFAQEVFSKYGELHLVPGRAITNSILKDADVLLIRSVTNVNEELLKNTKVKFVGTATIGTDHIDEKYLVQNDIYFTSAQGCNSYAVAEYVITAFALWCSEYNKSYKDIKFGIVGFGNIGTILYKFLFALGVQVIINDPPKSLIDNNHQYSTLDNVLKCDVISFHVPLNKGGVNNTIHLLNKENLDRINNEALIINSSRGPVVDNSAMLNKLKTNKLINCVLDVWENEPDILPELLDYIYLGTPHIAGYTYEGKVNGTKILFEKFCDYFSIDDAFNIKENRKPDTLCMEDTSEIEYQLQKLTQKIYDIKSDHNYFIKSLKNNLTEIPQRFDILRKEFKLRNEFSNYLVCGDSISYELKQILAQLRFHL